jgi:hypothetical protein
MSFPSSPVNNQTVTLNNITYVYSSTSNSWTRSQSVLSATSMNLTSTTTSSSIISGALLVSGGVGVGGNLNVGGNIAANLANATVDGTNKVGALNIPQNVQPSSYTLVASDAGKQIYHASGTAAATYTIPSNSSVPFPLGTTVTFVNMSTGSVTVSVNSDSLYLAGTTGTVTAAAVSQYGIVTATKVASTSWLI